MVEREDDVLDRVERHLKQPVRIDPALDRRVMAVIADLPAPGASRAAAAWRWLVTPRRVPIPPLAGFAVAAGLAAVVVTRVWQPTAPVPEPVAFQFVVVAPRAATVSLVGDFNDWDPVRTPMRQARAGSVWTVVVPLDPGRYRYAFLVDGAQWLADPAAPRAGDDEFGAPSSVVTVGES